MIIGHIRQANPIPGEHPLNTALDRLRNTDWDKEALGKQEWQGTELFAIVSEAATRPQAEALAESHALYADIHYVIAGHEHIGWTADPNQAVLERDLLEQEDACLYQTVGDEQWLVLHPGMYVIFLPGELHRPSCHATQPELVRKVVVKLHQSYLAG